MYTTKLASLAAIVMATTGSAQVINQETLVPIGLFIGATATITTIVWKLATANANYKRDLRELRDRLERIEKEAEDR